MKDKLALHSDDLAGRIPYRLRTGNDGNLMFSWLYVGETGFDEPFFEGSLIAALAAPENSGVLPLASADVLIQMASGMEMRNPDAFIFHASRCGSTLLAQMLASNNNFTVLAEVPLLDALFRLDKNEYGFSEQYIRQLFHSTLNLIAQRAGTDTRIVIKTDSWHVLSYSRLRTWYPDIPFFLIHRNTAEIAASQLQKPGMHAVAGVLPPALFGMNEEEASVMTREEYFGKVLVKYYKAYREIVSRDKNAWLLDYHDGPEKMLDRFLQKCKIQMKKDAINKMKKRAAFYSKDPQRIFSGDAYSPIALNETMHAAEKIRIGMAAPAAEDKIAEV